jgi:anti-sigma-K factor RskA
MNHPNAEQERLLDLLAERAVCGLDSSGQRELAELQLRYPEIDDQYYEIPAAAANLALEPDSEPLPEAIRQRILAQSERYCPIQCPSAARVPRPRASVLSSTGWIAAAACLALAVFTWRSVERPTPVPGLEERVAQDSARGRWDWQPTQDPAGANVKGEVVWSPNQQTGFMRFQGLAANNPSESVYQLWIFDESRDQRYPVDGGVFSIPPGSTSVTVPIQAKLAVKKPVMFAVTVEKPGGAVVSTRDRIAALAKVI